MSDSDEATTTPRPSPQQVADRIEAECHRAILSSSTLCASFATSLCAEIIAARDRSWEEEMVAKNAKSTALMTSYAKEIGAVRAELQREREKGTQK